MTEFIYNSYIVVLWNFDIWFGSQKRRYFYFTFVVVTKQVGNNQINKIFLVGFAVNLARYIWASFEFLTNFSLEKDKFCEH